MTRNVITWNLFHGRDAPPNRDLFTWRSRLLRRTETDATHAQVNRELLREFLAVLDGGGPDERSWQIALLQECPPRWAAGLAEACGAQGHHVLTSRNSLSRIRGAVARRNPDLIASGEGGCNLTLVRGEAGTIAGRRELELQTRPERRVMAFTETASGLCIANLHATNDQPAVAREELIHAAEAATAWAANRPLIFGGDFNLRPAEEADAPDGAFATLADRFGLGASTGPHAIDHILVRGLEILEAPAAWPAAAREVPAGLPARPELAIRLSDHAPVEATFSTH